MNQENIQDIYEETNIDVRYTPEAPKGETISK